MAAIASGPAVAAAEKKAEETAPPKIDFARDVGPVIKKYCFECHTGDEPEGEFSLYFDREQDFLNRASSEREFFEKMVESLRERVMPPDDVPQPADAERTRLIEWVERTLLASNAKAPRKAVAPRDNEKHSASVPPEAKPATREIGPSIPPKAANHVAALPSAATQTAPAPRNAMAASTPAETARTARRD